MRILYFCPIKTEMARKRFKGDATHRLPEGMMAPYLLWFTALQLAHRTPGLKVNKRFYREWGDIEGESFNDWWEENWRELFAVSIGVREIEVVEDFERSQDNASMIVRIPLDQTFKRTLEELREIQALHPSRPKPQKPRGKYSLTYISQFRLMKVRQYLRSYEFQLDGLNYKQIAISYCEWAKRWEKKRGKRGRIDPGNWRSLLIAIDAKEDIYADHSLYRSVRRMISKGKTIVENTARGEFPGKY